jgi:hypothetical protein
MTTPRAHGSHWNAKLDRALLDAANAKASTPVQVTVQTAPGRIDQVNERLTAVGGRGGHQIGSNLLAVELPSRVLKTVGQDRDVVRLSLDAHLTAAGTSTI